MGKRDRERIARIESGIIKPISEKTRERVVKAGTSILKHLSFNSQVNVLAESLRTGRMSREYLQSVLKENAPSEMRKGIIKLNNKGQALTVDNLLKEYRSDKGFQDLANEVGLSEQYFVDLATSELEAWRIKNA